jgi:hypothetical protein
MDHGGRPLALAIDFPEFPDAVILNERLERAHEMINDAYQYGWRALYASDSDAHRLRLHSTRLQHRTLRLLEAMEYELDAQAWFAEATSSLVNLIIALEATAEVASGR